MKHINELYKKIEDSSSFFLRYHVQEDTYNKKNNAENFEAMKVALDEVGVCLNIKDGKLVIFLNRSKYFRNKTRNAGTKKRRVQKPDGKAYKYSDIISMSQTMKDVEILKTIGMTTATYYRHKKAMKNSDYYKKVDKTKLSDIEYLKSIEGDFSF